MFQSIPVFDPAALSRAFESLQEPSHWGPWRVVMNSSDGRPFYFHCSDRVGQFEMPPELRRSQASAAVVAPSSSSSSSSAVCEVVAEDVDRLFPELPPPPPPHAEALMEASPPPPPAAAVPSAADQRVSLTMEEGDSSNSNNTTGGGGDDWSCAVCTFLNRQTETSCEMCGTQVRPKRSLATSQVKTQEGKKRRA